MAKSNIQAKATNAKKAAAGAKSESIQDRLIGLLRRPNGATISELSKATGWQAHSVRGAISGVLKKRLGLTIDSEASEKRGRIYRIASGN